jgi:hypothetical protein
MLAFNENEGVFARASFTDADGNPSLPTTVHYRLDCGTTFANLIDDTSVTPEVTVNASGQTEVTVEIAIPGSANEIRNNRNAREIKKLLVIANKDQDNEKSLESTYYVRNLQGR